MKKIITMLMAISIATTAFAEEKTIMKPDQLLGSVNGDNFYVRDWNAEFFSLKPEARAQGVEALLVPIRNAIVEKKALSAAAIKQGIDKKDAYITSMRKAKRDILTRLYFESMLPEKITNSQIGKEYRAFKKELGRQEEVHARHILVKTRNDADNIIKALNNGSDFIALAKSKSTGPSASSGGDLGFFARGQMVGAFENAVFSMKNGAISKKAIKTQFGWHIIKRESSRNKKVPALKDVKDMIAGRVRQKLAIKIISKAIKASKIVLYDAQGNKIK